MRGIFQDKAQSKRGDLLHRNSILNKSASSSHNSDLELFYYGSQKCTAADTWGPGVKQHYKLHYVHSGEGWLRPNRREYRITAGQLFACFPGETVFYRADAAQPWEYSWVAFDGLNAEQYLRRAGFRPDHLVIDCPNKPLIENAFREILSTKGDTANHDLNYIGYLYLVLASIVDYSGNDSDTSNAHKYVKIAIRYIRENYQRDISIEEIATYLSLDRKYFSKVFKRETGSSPMEYLIQYRIDKACELLQSSTLSVAEIAAAVGYTSQFSFSRVFKKHMNVAPSS